MPKYTVIPRHEDAWVLSAQNDADALNIVKEYNSNEHPSSGLMIVEIRKTTTISVWKENS